MSIARFGLLAAALAFVAVALAGCGGSESTPGGSGSTSGAAAGGGEAGGETLATYADPGGRFSLQYPGGWTQSASTRGGLKFNSGDQTLIFDLISAAGSDALAFAAGEESSLSAEFLSYRKLGLKQSPDIPGAAVLSFEWQSRSAVTGKAVLEQADRYYMPGPGGKMAVLTDSAPPGQFDPQNSLDHAKTVKVN